MEYTVRDAVAMDLDKLVAISRRVLAEAPTYTFTTFDENKCANYICGAILKQPGWFLRVIADENDDAVGGLICYCEPFIYSGDKIAYDVTLMIDAEHRGKCLAQLIQLIDEYKAWALAEGAKVIKFGISSGISVAKGARFLERLGFRHIGSMHAIVVGE